MRYGEEHHTPATSGCARPVSIPARGSKLAAASEPKDERRPEGRRSFFSGPDPAGDSGGAPQETGSRKLAYADLRPDLVAALLAFAAAAR